MAHDSSGDFTFTRSHGGSGFDTTGAVFHCTEADPYLEWLWVITGGTNNANVFIDPDMSYALRDFDLITRHCQNAFYILGVHISGSPLAMDIQVKQFNQKMAARYKERWIDVGGYMTRNGLALAGITPDATDISDMLRGKLITSLSNGDHVHPNTAGYTVWRLAVEQQIRVTGALPGIDPAPALPVLAVGTGPVPAAPSIGTPTDTEIPITISAVDGAVGYQVEYRERGRTAWAAGPRTTGTSATVADPITGVLKPGTTYEIRVVPYNAAGRGTPSSIAEGTTTGVAPAVITSDRFSIPGTLRGSATDCGLGGTAKTWSTNFSNPTKADGVLKATTTGNYTVDAGSPDHRVEVRVVTTTDASHQSVVLRYTDTSNYYRIQAYNATSGVRPGAGNNHIRINRRVGGSETTLAQTPFGGEALRAGDILGAEIVDDTIVAYVNGQAVLTATDSDISTGNGCGIVTAAPCQWDDFVVYDS